jgi:hypothetical protein
MAAEPQEDSNTPEQKATKADVSRLLTILEAHAKPKMSPDAKALMNALLADARARIEVAS